MGIQLGSQFDFSTSLPLDSRDVVADITARNAINSGVRYIGMAVKVLNDGSGNQKLYWLVGGTANANWQEFSSGGGSGGFNNIVSKTASTTILSSEDCVLVDATSGNITLTLPAYALKEQHNFIRTDSSSNTVTIQRAGSDQILTNEGLVTSYTLPFQGNNLKIVGISSALWGQF